jgi:putative ABC transport system substrate-binding protein
MRRREFISGLLLLAAVRAAPAQQPGRVHHIAIVHPSNPVSELTESGGLRGWPELFQELRRLGYVEGQNLRVERYSGEGRVARYAELAREVARSKPDAVVTVSSIMVQHFKAASATIPIVGVMADPVAWGFAGSLARPGANITGVSVETGGGEIWGKRLALLKEAVPSLSKVSFLALQTTWESLDGGIAIRGAARRMGVSVFGAPIKGAADEEEYRQLFAAISQNSVDGVIVGLDAENFTNRRLIVELAQQHRLPAMYPFYESVEVGGLITYAFDSVELWRHLAGPINQILKGASPAEIPIYQVTKLKLVVNTKAAKAIGLTIPPALVLRADEVIE